MQDKDKFKHVEQIYNLYFQNSTIYEDSDKEKDVVQNKNKYKFYNFLKNDTWANKTMHSHVDGEKYIDSEEG